MNRDAKAKLLKQPPAPGKAEVMSRKAYCEIASTRLREIAKELDAAADHVDVSHTDHLRELYLERDAGAIIWGACQRKVLQKFERFTQIAMRDDDFGPEDFSSFLDAATAYVELYYYDFAPGYIAIKMPDGSARGQDNVENVVDAADRAIKRNRVMACRVLAAMIEDSSDGKLGGISGEGISRDGWLIFRGHRIKLTQCQGQIMRRVWKDQRFAIDMMAEICDGKDALKQHAKRINKIISPTGIILNIEGNDLVLSLPK